MSKITIYKIAKECGVSPATVSRVITNSANVREDKKEKILEVIKKYNFTPNPIAKALSETKTNTIGMIVTDIINPFYATVFEKTSQIAHEKGYKLVLYSTGNNRELEIEYIENLVKQKVDLIVMVGGSVDNISPSEEFLNLIEKVSKHTAIIACTEQAFDNCTSISIDAENGMKMAVEYLTNIGHKNIVFVSGSEDALVTLCKDKSYTYSMEKLNLKPKIIHAGFDKSSGFRAMEKIMKECVTPTAIIAINDLTAVGIINFGKENFINMPEEISVISFDSTFICDIVSPTLTAVSLDFEEYGTCIVKTAINLIEKKESEKIVVVPTKIQRRKSCTAVK